MRSFHAPPARPAYERARTGIRARARVPRAPRPEPLPGDQAVSCSASPRALTSRSISASVLMKGGASCTVSPP